MWNKLAKDKEISVLCPGYFLECLLLPLVAAILKINKFFIKQFIVPKYYHGMLKEFDLDVGYGDIINPIIEYDRLNEARDAFPAPIFFDADKNVYLNLLFNYGKKIPASGIEAPEWVEQISPSQRNEPPFWRQILNNLCMGHNAVFPKLNYEWARETANQYLRGSGIKGNGRYVLMDNPCLFGLAADKRIIEPQYYFPIQIKEIADYLKRQKIELVIMSNDAGEYRKLGLNNIIPSWANINSELVLALLGSACGVISWDQNIYLSAALLDVKSIVCLDDPPMGWRFDDVIALTREEKGNWVIADKNKSLLQIIGEIWR